MHRTKKSGLVGLFLPVAMVAGMSVALAQQTQHQHGIMGQGMMSEPMIQGRLAYVKAELEITEAQSAAWNDYANAVNTQMSSMQCMHQSMMQAMQSGSAAERMDAHIKALEARTEALRALKPATEALYAVLTPDQKQKADQLLGMGCCMMM